MYSEFTAIDDFYPTPDSLLDKIIDEKILKRVSTILEPSAGKGNICDYIYKLKNPYEYSHEEVDIDTIEADETLAATLRGKGYRVISSNFLEFESYKKYDLLIMNPPFSQDAKHLLKALSLQKDGGAIICILNAQTLKNAYSSERKYLLQQLERYNAIVEFMEHEFEQAERKTSVEIAVVKVDIPKKELDSEFLGRLRKHYYKEADEVTSTAALAENDVVEAFIREYKIELEAGIKLINEFYAFNSKCPLLSMKLSKDASRSYSDSLTVNAFVKEVNYKYWSLLFNNEKFTGKMTSKQMSEWYNQLAELQNYEFSRYNIMEVYKKMNSELISGIEETIIKLFDELTHQHSWYPTSTNIHYFSGWKTNCAYMLNSKKVIIPFMNAYSRFSGDFRGYEVQSKLEDIEKALNYLDGGLTEGVSIRQALNEAERNGQTKGVRFKYFTADFMKKGTTHLKWHPECAELLKKFNIFGAQHKGWLPQGFGERFYEDLDAEEKEVIDSFCGKDEYKKVIDKADYFIYKPKDHLPMLTA